VSGDITPTKKVTIAYGNGGGKVEMYEYACSACIKKVSDCADKLLFLVLSVLINARDAANAK